MKGGPLGVLLGPLADERASRGAARGQKGGLNFQEKRNETKKNPDFYFLFLVFGAQIEGQ